MMFPQYGDRFLVDADHPGSAALGCSFDSLAADNGGRPAESNLSCAKIHGLPPEVKQFAATRAGVGSKTVEGEQPVDACDSQEGIQLFCGPDPARFGAAITRALGSFGRVDSQQLLDIDSVRQGLAQGAVYVGDGPTRQWPTVRTAMLRQLA